MNDSRQVDDSRSGYLGLESDPYGAYARGGLSAALIGSLLLHVTLMGLPLLLTAGQQAKKRKLEIASASTTTPSFNVTLKTRRPPQQATDAGKKAAVGGGEKKKAGRFNSDVVREHTRAVLSNIVYPRTARRLGWQGRVRIRALVGSDGGVLNAKVVAGSGYGILDRAALAGVRKHRFNPGEGNETITLSLRFQLSED